MKVALLSLAMMGGQFTIPVSDRVPDLNVEATCKATVATDKEMGLDLPQSYEDCMRDENNALQQLNILWLQNSDTLRSQCEGEATAGGSDSYVDLLTCMQMADWAKSPPSAPKLRGASKNRSKL
ncbi:hypothetical protein FXV83_01730 [Bradyrhizobium hipponense]|uniref:Uncharacterized protein n=1 Tax=Bradyrhizobium hipponense TaxID=2605638 RepID=A0A5S4YWN7_9BRAD|nr:hypothetical protein [Bradyrhizobium hipponense]TYO68257.1 hypothetical protein FXV83_01730 [Bradyrhizobium hipponense]